MSCCSASRQSSRVMCSKPPCEAYAAINRWRIFAGSLGKTGVWSVDAWAACRGFSFPGVFNARSS